MKNIFTLCREKLFLRVLTVCTVNISNICQPCRAVNKMKYDVTVGIIGENRDAGPLSEMYRYIETALVRVRVVGLQFIKRLKPILGWIKR